MELHVANISKRNPKEFYRYIKRKIVFTSTNGPLLDENRDFTTDDLRMNSILNSFFVSVFTSENCNYCISQHHQQPLLPGEWHRCQAHHSRKLHGTTTVSFRSFLILYIYREHCMVVWMEL